VPIRFGPNNGMLSRGPLGPSGPFTELLASLVGNDSTVAGNTVKDALETLAGVAGVNAPVQLYAGQLSAPLNASYAVNAIAPAITSLNFPNLTVRDCDDTLEEGYVFEIEPPATAVGLIVHTIGAADVGPGADAVVKMHWYAYPLPDLAAPGPWSAAVDLDDMDVTVAQGTSFGYYATTDTLANWGLVAGEAAQVQITRDSPNAGDTLSGGWHVLAHLLEWTS